MECDRQVDPVWYYATMRRERQRQRVEEYRKQREEQFKFKNLEEITDILTAEMGGVSSSVYDSRQYSAGCVGFITRILKVSSESTALSKKVTLSIWNFDIL